MTPILRVWRVLLLPLLLVLCGNGCATLNVGTDNPERMSVLLHAPLGTGSNGPYLYGFESARFDAEIQGGTAPYSIQWRFGGAAPDQMSTLNEAGNSSVSVVFPPLAAATEFTATITVTDAPGLTVRESVTFTVITSQGPEPPTLDSLSFLNGVISVTASSADVGAVITYSATLDSGNVTISGPINATNSSAEFLVSPLDILAGGNFTVTVTATAHFWPEYAVSDSDSVSGSFAAFPLADDTLYAIATKSHASVGDKVRIIVATGKTAHPFLIHHSSVVVENTARLVHASVDAGAPDDDGQANTPVDGVWADLGASGLFFEVGTGGYLVSTDLGDGTWYVPVYVLPFDANPAQVSGLVGSFELEFREPGEYHLSFLRENIVSQTYYQDIIDGPDYFWGDISNNHAYNTIVVE